MRRRLANIFAAASLLVFVLTGTHWLKLTLRDYLEYDLPLRWLGPIGIVGNYNSSTRPFPRFSLVATDSFELRTLHPRPGVVGPEYLTPEYKQWEKQFSRHDVVLKGLGFHYFYWKQIRLGNFVPENPKASHFYGYESEVAVPFWFVLVCSALPPIFWLRRHFRLRRRRKLGLCALCGYHLRASPGRCPECGNDAGATLPGHVTPKPIA